MSKRLCCPRLSLVVRIIIPQKHYIYSKDCGATLQKYFSLIILRLQSFKKIVTIYTAVQFFRKLLWSWVIDSMQRQNNLRKTTTNNLFYLVYLTNTFDTFYPPVNWADSIFSRKKCKRLRVIKTQYQPVIHGIQNFYIYLVKPQL